MVTVAAPPRPSIAARLDRLPVSWELMRLALVALRVTNRSPNQEKERGVP